MIIEFHLGVVNYRFKYFSGEKSDKIGTVIDFNVISLL